MASRDMTDLICELVLLILLWVTATSQLRPLALLRLCVLTLLVTALIFVCATQMAQ